VLSLTFGAAFVKRWHDTHPAPDEFSSHRHTFSFGGLLIIPFHLHLDFQLACFLQIFGLELACIIIYNVHKFNTELVFPCDNATEFLIFPKTGGGGWCCPVWISVGNTDYLYWHFSYFTFPSSKNSRIVLRLDRDDFQILSILHVTSHHTFWCRRNSLSYWVRHN
jgi:hypothetical protein